MNKSHEPHTDGGAGMHCLPLHRLFKELQVRDDSVRFRAGEPGIWCVHASSLKPYPALGEGMPEGLCLSTAG